MRKTANIELEARSLDLLLELFCDEKYARYRFSAEFLSGLETKVVNSSHALKIETSKYRVWLMITGFKKGHVVVEEQFEKCGILGDFWKTVLVYDGSKL